MLHLFTALSGKIFGLKSASSLLQNCILSGPVRNLLSISSVLIEKSVQMLIQKRKEKELKDFKKLHFLLVVLKRHSTERVKIAESSTTRYKHKDRPELP